MHDPVVPEVDTWTPDPLSRTEQAEPVFLQGVFPFIGCGLLEPSLLHPDLCYTVPPQQVARLIYFRAGNASDGLIYLSVVANGRVRRFFPISPQGATHVPLAIREGIDGETRVEIHLAAPAGVLGTVIVDAGLVVHGSGVR